MKSKKEIEEQLQNALKELQIIEKEILLGSGIWRGTKGYIDALEWVLEIG